MFYTDNNILKEYRSENRIWQGIPGIEVTKGGRIFITFYSGGTSEEIGNFVVLLKAERGRAFSEPIAVAVKEGFRCYDPCLWIDPLNRLWFTWAIAPENAVYGVICDDPDADELRWSDVMKIGNDVMMNKPTVLRSGEWLFPIAVWDENLLPQFRSKETDRRAFVYLSNDDGKSFSKIGGINAKNRSYDEHMILELNDGRLAMFIRTTYGIGVSYSYDGGRNWTESVNSGLGGPCSRFHIRRLKSGRIMLINHYNYTGRNNLTVFLSDDDGRTWSHQLLLDERGDVSYPDAKEADDGYIYIVYDRERGSFKKTLEEAYSCAREILMAKITEEDIIAGKIVNKGSETKTVVSKLGKYKDEDTNPYREINRYSDSRLAEILSDKSTEDIISELFDAYRIDCMNMYKLDSKKLDMLIGKVENNEGNRTRNIHEIIKLIRSVHGKEDIDLPIISRVKKFIEDNIEENISVGEIADTMNMSIYYLCHIFKKATNITLMAYKNYIKIERAKELLKNSDDKIEEIASKCGFENSSYFSETFKKTEGVSPAAYRDLMHNRKCFEKDAVLRSLLPGIDLLDTDVMELEKSDKVKTYIVCMPDESLSFLHESAIIKFHGRLIAAWYNNGKHELLGYTPIRFAFSDNDGANWSEPITVVDDKSEKILYCPPVFGIDNGRLYMLLNQMVAPDHIHSLDLYIYNEDDNRFDFVWSKAIPFKLNTNVYRMENGKLILPGRIANMDDFPQIPAVLISDDGKIDSNWRLVKVQETKKLPDNSEFIHPELSLIVDNNKIYGFCRNDVRKVPILFKSEDYGESWTGPYASDIPFSNSKIYSGTLSDGRNYVIGNLDGSRETLYILFSRAGEIRFNKGFILQKGFSEELGFGRYWSYPSAYEADSKLYIIYTAGDKDDRDKRGAVVSVIDLTETDK